MRNLKRRKKDKPKRPLDTTGLKKTNKLYNYNVISNKAKILKNQCVRFYQDDGNYIELEPIDDYLVLRASGDGLARINIRPKASNQLDVKAIKYDITKF